MNDTIKKALARASAFAGVVLALGTVNSVHAQPTTQVFPRVYTLVANQVLTNGQVLGSGNIAAGVYASTNTFLPYSGVHAIGLWATVNSTNNVGHTNVVVGLTYAYDTSGGSVTSINGRYGTNFVTTPTVVWSIPLNGTTNVTAGTNLPPTQWEPATSIAVAYVSNLCSTNITFQLQASVVP